MRRLAPAFVLALLTLAPVAAEEKGDFFFRKGDRIVFLGDSITEQYQYSTLLETYLTTRFPDWDLTFLNAGIGGDTAAGGARRFAEHVLAEKPTAVTINFGMNDAGYGKFDEARRAAYVKFTKAMLDAAKSAGVRVALVSPNAVDPRYASADRDFTLYRDTQRQFYAPLKDLAAESGAAFADQYATTRAAQEKMEADGAKDVKPYYDGFHTAWPGGLLMAHSILTGLHAPAPVSGVVVDAASGEAKGARCQMANVVARSDGVAFDRTDEALPLPVQQEWVSLLPYVNQLKDLNWYSLRVSGLKAGKYAVTVDGQEVGRYSAEELAAGVNLGNATTGPVHAQAQKVFEAINAKNKVVHQRFRQVVMFQAPDWLADVAKERKPKELARRLEQIAARQAEVYKLAQPTKHRFEVKAAE